MSSIAGTVNGVANPTFLYDANGNMTAGASRAFTWTSFNMPSTIKSCFGSVVANCNTTRFLYNPEHERTIENQADGSQVVTLSPRYDTGLHFEKRYLVNAAKVRTGAVEYEHYLYAGGLMFGKFIQNTAVDGVTVASTSYEYYTKDHLGSIVAITGPAGGVMQRLSYDVWGKRRYPNGTADPNGLLNNPDMYHGYTGHEMLDDVGLIHMNGRLYDPMMARFVSADFLIQAPGNLQSYNRYTYCVNNPLGMIDPSGQSWWTSFRDSVVKPVAFAALAYYTGGLVANAWAATTTVGGAASAASAAMAAGGAATSGFAGAAAGMAVQSTLSGALMYGAIQGATAGFVGGMLMSGGNLDYAFKSALAGGITGGLTSFGGAAGDWAGRIAGQSLGSGINAQLNGGDFMNGLKYGLMGAVKSEAFSYLQARTDDLKIRACAAGSGDQCIHDEHGLRTDGARGVDWDTHNPTHARNFITDSGMADEGSGKHLYDIGQRFESALAANFVNKVSKVHDFFNSWNYNEVGKFVSRGEGFDTIFQLFSFAGMPVAARVTADMLWQNPLQSKR